jgi:glycosyltransferase involved in cell wall biosynthesis
LQTQEPKILFTVDSLHRGGKERQLCILASELIKQNYSITILSKFNGEVNYINEYGLENYIINFSDGNLFCSFLKFCKEISKNNPDLVVSWDNQTAYFSIILKFLYKYSFINASLRHGIRLFKISHLIRSFGYMLSPYIIANSYEGLKTNNLKLNQKNIVIHNGIDKSAFYPLSLQEIQLKRKKILFNYQFQQDIIYISVGNFTPFKDYETTLKALSLIKLHKSFYFLIIGDGPGRNDLKNLVTHLNLNDNVLFLGKIEDVYTYLKISDVFIHSSRGEGLSNAILEAMFAGLPIIATDVGGTSELVYSGSSYLFNYKDSMSLAQILLNCEQKFKLFNPNSVDYETHLDKFTTKSMVENFKFFFKYVLNND